MPHARAETLFRTLVGSRNDWRLRLPLKPAAPAPSIAWLGPAVLLSATAAGWLAFADAVGDEGDVAFALFIGSVSILLMVWSNVLATRWQVIEPFFGGLDRMYRWHRWFGALSVAAMWWHIQTVDEVRGIRGASKDVADAAEDLAGLGEKFLYVLVIVSLVRWVPYRWWRQSHKLLIVPFVFASWHFHTATKPYANSSAWGRWFQALMILGVVAWAHRVLWRDGVRRGRGYVVSSMSTAGSATTVELSPVGRPIDWRPGQFVFVRFGSGPASEPHPFTIASAPEAGPMRLVVKDLGDWSAAVATRVSVGDLVKVEGPYGRLRLVPRRQQTVVWIAGGVGITPFLAGASRRWKHAVPHLFYAVRDREDAPGLAELEAAADAGRIVLHVCVSGEGNRLCARHLDDVFGSDDLAGAHVAMCGPDSMVRDMTLAARERGVGHVHVEAFDIRTGVGPDLSHEVDELAGVARQRWADLRLRRRESVGA